MDVLQSIPGLAGYLSMQQHQQQQAQGELRQVMGLASLLQRQQEVQQRAQLAPLQAQLLQAQVGQAQGLADQRQREGAFNQAFPGLVQQATGENGQLDMSRLSGLLMQTPGGLKPGMDLRRTEEDRVARVQQAQSILDQRKAQAEMLHESRLSAAKTAEERAVEDARHNRAMEGLSAQMRSIAAMNAARGPAPTVVQTDNGPMQVDRAGNARPIVGPDGSPVSAKKTGTGHLTESEAKGTLFYRQMKTANDQLEKVVGSGFSDKELPGQIAMRMARSDWTNWMAPAKAQQYAQATEQWAEAYLRLKTGAATNRDEIVRNARTYFPQPGDSPEVIKQKADMRRQAEEDVSIVAGRGMDAIQKPKPASTPDIDSLLRKYGG